MRRFFSHYTFIYPDIFLKNCIVSLNDMFEIDEVFFFENEIERTEFYSGVLFLVPTGMVWCEIFEAEANRRLQTADFELQIDLPKGAYTVYYEGKII